MHPKLLLLDLDGTVYRGDDPIPGAAETIRAARAAGVRVLFVTNRANRTEAVVVRQLTSLGIPCRRGDVVTTAAAAAAHCAARGGGRCFLVGGRGLREAFAAHGLDSAPDGPAEWVVVSLDLHFTYAKLARATALVLGGARFVATNPDRLITVGDALLPEAGALVAAVRVATGVEPVVIGKPSPTLFQEALRAAGCNPGDALAVGDCLDTDIAAATAAGIPSCLLLTGVTTRDDADRSPLRPTVVCDNWAGLRQCLSLRKEHPASPFPESQNENC
jgi:4-nitrophenyl phosphatase